MTGLRAARWAAAFLLSIGFAAAAQAACREDIVDLRSDRGVSRFHVEIADDPAERAKGLMFRESMPESDGMLFLFDPPEDAAFWMKNTPLPLDLVFIDAEGRVARVTPDAVPQSTAPMPAGQPVRAVLEINAGLAARFGIVEGAEARHPAFGPGAAWPCAD